MVDSLGFKMLGSLNSQYGIRCFLYLYYIKTKTVHLSEWNTQFCCLQESPLWKESMIKQKSSEFWPMPGDTGVFLNE
jgi:hypothetical protein